MQTEEASAFREATENRVSMIVQSAHSNYNEKLYPFYFTDMIVVDKDVSESKKHHDSYKSIQPCICARQLRP